MCFNVMYIDIICAIYYKYFHGRRFLLHPSQSRLAETLRGPARFSRRASTGPHRCRAIRLHHRAISISCAIGSSTANSISPSRRLEGSARRRRVSAETRRKIRSWRERRLCAAEITESVLLEDGVDISVRTVERVLAEEGFEKLPRRTRLKIGRTVQGAQIPDGPLAG